MVEKRGQGMYICFLSSMCERRGTYVRDSSVHVLEWERYFFEGDGRAQECKH